MNSIIIIMKTAKTTANPASVRSQCALHYDKFKIIIIIIIIIIRDNSNNNTVDYTS